MRLIVLIILSSFFSMWPQRGTSAYPPFSEPEIQERDFCDLLANPLAYDKKVVRTTAILRYGGEDTTDLYCPECLASGTVRPVFSKSLESCTKPKALETISRQKHSSGTVRVILIGTFYKERQLQIECLERAGYISREYHLPDRLSAKTLRQITCRPSSIRKK
jgi:hypothetical protein